jgi:AcrR family transcriptional regulator
MNRIPQPTRLPAGARRATIIDAAGEAFGERGYEATTLDEIAAQAGVTKPILYRHFGSKQALYLALLDRHREDLETFGAAIPEAGRPQERLRAVLAFWLDYVEDHSYAWKMLFRDSGGGATIAAARGEVHARAREVLAGLIRSLARASIPRREVEPLAELMSMGMASLVLWWIDNPGASRAAIIDAMARVWAGLLLGAREPAA